MIGLTAVTMAVEIAAGHATGSMALLADGWHMATHVGALGLAAFAYAFARRYASHRAFAFGTGKVHALAGFTSALGLALIGGATIYESMARLVSPRAVDYALSLPVAAVGLVVNLVSVVLLHDGHHHEQHHHEQHHHEEHHHEEHHHEEHHHGGDHDHVQGPNEELRVVVHDHSHRAAFLHVVADALTSALAIAALLAGRYVGWRWLDPATGILGGAVILKWSLGLCRTTAFELVDVDPTRRAERRASEVLERLDGTTVVDLHVWSLGHGALACIATVVGAEHLDAASYREALLRRGFSHVTVEVRRHATPDERLHRPRRSEPR